jgi:hypothetical protein
MIIDVEFDASTKNAPAGFFTAVNAAVEYWEREIINPITVTIQFGYNQVDGQTIGSNALAESESLGGPNVAYAQLKAALTSDATSANDQIAVAHLPASDPTSGAGFFVPLPEGEVLGLDRTSNQLVGYAGLSSAFPFTFDPNNRAVAGDFDAIGAMEHEITEVLGRIAGSGTIEGGTPSYSPLDLFRYASAGQLALTPEAASFSIDGTDLLLPFNNPAGGNDAGDWAPSVRGDSFGEGSQGQAALVSATDLEVMDVLGFTLAPDPTARDDFNADGKSDFLIQNTAGVVVVGEVSGGQAAFTAVTDLGPEWAFRGDGDFLGAGHDQAIIENTAGAVVVADVENGQAQFTQVASLGPEWKFVGVGDFLGLGDGSQFLIENAAGAVVVGNAESQTAVYTQVASLGPEWTFVGAGNFLGDGKSEFLIVNTAGAVFTGEVTNGATTFTHVTSLGPEWSFVGSGNLLGDGKDDFLIENTAGAVVVAEVTNGQATFTQIASLGPEWKFVGTGDYFSEGHDQFLIENTAGAVDVGDWSGGQIHYTQVTGLGSEWAFH